MRLQWIPVFVFLYAGTVAGSVWAFPIRTTSPGTGVFEGTTAVGRAMFIHKTGDAGEVDVYSVSSFANYSPTTNLVFGVVVPYVYKSFSGFGAGQGTTSGLGDILLTGKYRFYKSVGLRRQTQAAFRTALKLPTGSTGRILDPRIPPIASRSLQPGSGSLDVILDVSFLKQVKRWSLGGNIAYRFNTSDDGIRFGDQFIVGNGLEYILLPRKYPGNELYLLLETTYVHSQANELHGHKVRSGGDQFFIAPGLQYIALENLLLESSFQFPLLQNIKGSEPSTDYNILFGFRFLW